MTKSILQWGNKQWVEGSDYHGSHKTSQNTSQAELSDVKTQVNIVASVLFKQYDNQVLYLG